MIKEKKRKVRSDKKKDVKPTINVELKDCIYRISYITQTPVKDVAYMLCDRGLLSKDVMSFLSEQFRRTVRLKSTLYIGDIERPSLRTRSLAGQKEKITIRFDSVSYENLCTLAYAMDVTPTRATALLLDASIHHSDIINDYVKDHIQGHLSDSRMKELRKVLQFLNENNPYEAEVSWSSFLSYLYEDLKSGDITVSESIQEFLKRWRNM